MIKSKSNLMNFQKKTLIPLKKILIFLILFYSISIVSLVSLKKYYKQKFNPQKLNFILESSSRFKDLTDNPCAYQIVGDPDVGKNYIKIGLNCNNARTINTLSLNALNEKTLVGALKALAFMNNFQLKLEKIECYIDNQKINNLNISLKEQSNIECFFK